ncbi:hypothetical protein V499_02408 [Pseudogymnoascus sp. VKM F-103]|nr:hypothetical protein V499_02408 [Pseudogymnoascus sp. VKM F-103]
MHKLALALGLFLSPVAAEYTTTLLVPGLDLDPQAIGGYVGSVIATVPLPPPFFHPPSHHATNLPSQDATATTYALSCPLAVGNACGVPASLLITQGPSTLHYAFPTGSGDMTADCKLTGTQGVCSGSILATGAQHGVVTVGYKSFGMYDEVVVTITGAAPEATGEGGAGAATATGTATGEPAGQTAGSLGSGGGAGGEASSATGSSSSAVSSKASTGGMPMITGHAQWVIGGAGAAVAIAAM